MPYFRTIIRGIDRSLLDDGSIQEMPMQAMGYTIQIPGHARSHTIEPGTGRRIFPGVNQNPNGPLRVRFQHGVCFIPDPETATDEQCQAARCGNKEVAQKMLDFLSNENNGLFGIKYEYDPNDRDGYWQKHGKVAVNYVPVKETVSKSEHKKVQAEMAAAKQTVVSESDSKAEALGEAVGKGLQEADTKARKRSRPRGRPRVIHGAKSTAD